MICYVRSGHDPIQPIAGADAGSLLLDVDFANDPGVLDRVAQTVSAVPHASVLVLMTGMANLVPEAFETNVQAWAPMGGVWLPGPDVAGVAACLSLRQPESLATLLRRVTTLTNWPSPQPWASPVHSRDEPSMIPAPRDSVVDTSMDRVERALAEAVRQQVEATRQVGKLMIEEIRRADRDVVVLNDRSASKESAIFARSAFVGAAPVRDPMLLLESALQLAPRDGLCLEFGVYEGRTIDRIAETWDGDVYGFDSFEGLPEEWRPGFPAGAFATEVRPCGERVHLVKGWFSDTLPSFMRQHDGPVSFAHIDCDLYSSTATVLRNIGDRLRVGSILVFDEYYNYPSWQQHEHRAWVEYAGSQGMSFDYLGYVPDGQQVAVRVTDVAVDR